MPDERGPALLALARAVEATGYRFTTVTPATHALVNARVGNEWATDLAGVFGWSRPFRQGVLPPALFALMREAGVAVHCGEGWRALVRLTSLGDRLFIHSAFPTTETDAVFFGPDTYRFASALNRHLDARSAELRRAVDIGCGAGAGAILIALRHPHAEVLAVDINREALRLAAINAELAGASNISFEYSDLLSAVEGEFDVITANPPYLLDASERAYRHGGGDLGEGLSLAIVRAALERLAPGGSLVLYTGVAIVKGVDRFHEAVRDLLGNVPVEWDYAELDPDVFGEELREPAYRNTERIAAVLLTLTRNGQFIS
jgi:methylase of polypeptide subunit release factors